MMSEESYSFEEPKEKESDDYSYVNFDFLSVLSKPKDYYKILEVDWNASEDVIRSNYIRLVLKWHPDKQKGGDTDTSKFQEINEAYKVLSDPAKRHEYDKKGILYSCDSNIMEYIDRHKSLILTCNEALPEAQDMVRRPCRQAHPTAQPPDQLAEEAQEPGQASDAVEPDLEGPEQDAEHGVGKRLRKRKKKARTVEVDPDASSSESDVGENKKHRFSKAIFSEILPIAIKSFQRAEVYESEMLKYKKKYKAVKAMLRSANADRVAELEMELTGLRSERCRWDEEARVRSVELQSALERIQTMESSHAAELSAIQAETKHKVQQAKAAGWNDGRTEALSEGQAKIDAMLESFRNAKVGIERYAIREFIEGPAFDEANTVMAAIDLEAGFKLAYNQIKNQGLIPVTFNESSIGLDKPDPYPDPTEEDSEPPVEIDWCHHKYGFAVDMAYAKRDKRAPVYELPPPIDLESFLPPTRLGRDKSSAPSGPSSSSPSASHY